MDTHTSVWMKSAPATAAAGSSVRVMVARVRPAMSRARSVMSLGGCRSAGSAVGAHQGAHDQQGAAHVEPAVPDVGVAELVVGFAAGLVHGQEVPDRVHRAVLRVGTGLDL